MVKAGQVGLNCYALDSAPPQCPWVGHKRSGFGYHSGADGWRQFSTPKSLIVAADGGPSKAACTGVRVLKEPLYVAAIAAGAGLALGLALGRHRE